MEARYLTDENGKRLFVILGIEEYERLREIEDEMEDVRRYDEAMARRERGEDDTIWGSMVKQALKRRKPGFNERYYGFRSFNELLEEAQARRLLHLERDAKSGGYAVRTIGVE